MNHSKSRSKNIKLEISTLLSFLAALFLTLSLFTYTGSDASMFSSSTSDVMNACGKIGASVSAFLLQIFGLGAFLFPAAFFFISAHLYQDEENKIVYTLIGTLVQAVSASVFLTLHWQNFNFGGSQLLMGGTFGLLIAQGLKTQLNPAGASLVSLGVFFGVLVLTTPVMISRVIGMSLRALAIVAWRVVKLAAVTAAIYGMDAFTKFVRYAGQKLHDFRINMKERSLAIAQKMNEPKPTVQQELFQEPITQPLAESLSNSLVDEIPLTAKTVESISRDEIDAINISELKITQEDAAATEPTKIDRIRTAMRSSKRGQWKLPAVDFLKKALKVESIVDKEKIEENARLLKRTLESFEIEGEVTAARQGPVITLYEFRPAPGVKVSKIAGLQDDITMALSAKSVRILAPLPGKNVVGFEIPSEQRQTILFREFIQAPEYNDSKHTIPVIMGKDISGQLVLADLARMPHLLVAGQTGSGKSVFMNSLICSLLYRFTPDDLRLILIDPKFIELTAYNDIPHLLLPVVDDVKNAGVSLKWAVREMERRYRILQLMDAKNLTGFNQKITDMGADAARDIFMAEENDDWIHSFELDDNGEPKIGKLPYVVIIIDELADLIMSSKKEVEISITRLAQKARAAGIHLVIATQRPSTDVVTGLIKANLPSRCSFQLASGVDSKTILDRVGAERLLGHGDMLFIPPGMANTTRLHGAYLDDNEISKITSFLTSQGKPSYRDEILVDEEEEEENEEHDADELFTEAVTHARQVGRVSASSLQRRFSIGYNRAARMIENMESRGIVGPADGAKPREVLMR
ncbi:MAG: DNA translocase FtsK 4TM domain-containing protein [Xanthomonadaceae bacterium]|nr:DNA translocase FtsK 4TM domain-containing protein [Xanthomonadaceae bacterium]